MKVIIYSSKEIYINSPVAGQAEAELIAYRDGNDYVITKDRLQVNHGISRVAQYRLGRMIEIKEQELLNTQPE